MNNIFFCFLPKKALPKANLHQEGTSPHPFPTISSWRGTSGAQDKAS